MTALTGVEQVPGLWKQQLGATKIAWATLTEDELLTLDGQQEPLVGLIHERYALTRAEAGLQARHFFDISEA